MMVGKKENHEKQKLSERILLHLGNCADFGFSYRFNKKFGLPQFPGRIFRDLIKVNEKDFKNSITDLKKFRFIEKKRNYDGSILISLTEKGMLRVLNSKFRRLANKKEAWDGKWRMVAFDIPEECRKGRNALRYKMCLAGFYELQESLFLYPYDCRGEIEAFSKLFKLEKYIRFALLEFIDNEDLLRRHFKLE
ncbi:MAG: hypothetical protein WC711_02510 [Candidatus Staskawiczbacteria bacterium]|jgi:hypothetical protein